MAFQWPGHIGASAHQLSVISPPCCPLGSPPPPSTCSPASSAQDSAPCPATEADTKEQGKDMVLVNNFTHCNDGPFVSHFNNCQVGPIINNTKMK